MIHPRRFAPLLVLLATPALAQEADDFTIGVRAQAMVDAGYIGMGKNPPGTDYNSGANLRRAQINVGGDFGDGWSYSVGGVFSSRGSQTGMRLNGSIEYQHANSLGFRAGVFSAPSGMGGNTNAASELMLERPSAVSIARSTAASPQRVTFSGFSQGPRHLVAVSLTGGAVASGGRYDNQQAVVGRAAWLAVDDGDWRWVMDGAISHVFRLDEAAGPGTGVIRLRDGPEVSVDVTRDLDTGNLDARSLTSWNLESGATWRSLYLQGGYFRYGVQRRMAVPDSSFHGWYLQGSWFLTGEGRLYNADTANFRPPTPASPLGEGGFGAFELTARTSVVDLNFNALAGPGAVTGGRQTIFATGLNWYANAQMRLSLVYDNFRIVHPEAPGRDLSGDALVLRAQYAL